METAHKTDHKTHAVELQAQDGQIIIGGYYQPGFEAFAAAFTENFQSRGEIGASASLYHRGVSVARLWGGVADPEGSQAWERDTLSLVFSATKAVTAVAIHMLVEAGLIDLDMPVSQIWPEYGCAGKESTTIAMVLDHTSGVPALQAPLKPDCLVDHDYMAQMIATAEPFWEPGTRTSYHPLIGGFILAEIIRRVTGQSLGAFVDEKIARPLNMDFWIGLPAEQEPRVAPMIPYRPARDAAITRFSASIRQQGSLQNLFFFNHGDWQSSGMNTRAGRAAEIGAAGGVTNAEGLAAFYAALTPGSVLGLSEQRLRSFSHASSATHIDGMLLQPTRFSSGFMLRMDNRSRPDSDSLLISDQAFGHVGAGGSIGFRDPEADIAFGYTMNRMGPGFLLNERGQALLEAAYSAAAGS